MTLPGAVADDKEMVRQQLRKWGWTDWAEADLREDGRLAHGAHLFTEQHSCGPLVEWLHPTDCECSL